MVPGTISSDTGADNEAARVPGTVSHNAIRRTAFSMNSDSAMEASLGRSDKERSRGKTKPNPNVTLEGSARIAAIAKYEVRKSIKEVVPEDVTHAKAGAWLTLISPITQWAGLKGDELAYKRTLLRLQQEETLLEIAKRAKSRISALESPGPIPNKFMVPFLEKASLEEEDSTLVDLWAGLLVSAAEDYKPHYIHFSNIISQISARQAGVFSDLIGTGRASDLEASMDSLFIDYDSEFLKTYLTKSFTQKSPPATTAEDANNFIDEALNLVGTDIKHVELTDSEDDSYFVSGTTSSSTYTDDLETDYAILSAIGLIRYVDTGLIKLGERWIVKVFFYCVTPLGREFAKACGVVS
jgi:hypothetical protein